MKLLDLFKEAFMGKLTISFMKLNPVTSLELTPEQTIYGQQLKERADAFAYVLVQEGTAQKLKQVNFLVDKPYRLENPNATDIRSIFEQLYEYGLVPVSVVTDIPGYGLRTYQSRDYLPDIAYAHGFARG